VSFYCTNVVEDFTSEFMDKIPTADFIIVNFGGVKRKQLPFSALFHFKYKKSGRFSIWFHSILHFIRKHVLHKEILMKV